MSDAPGARFSASHWPAALGRLSSRLGPVLTPRLTGYVDRMVAGEAFGWAFNVSRPERRVLVIATLGGRVVAESLADLPRRDLQASGKGDGRCGFRIKLPPLSPEETAALRIEAAVGLGRREIKKSARFRKVGIELQDRAASVVDDRASRHPAVGFLERCQGGVLKGWAVNPHDPDTPARVDIFDGERFLGATTAEVARPRLKKSNAPFGARGFEFRLPGTDIPPDRLRARVAGTRIDLRRSRGYLGETGDHEHAEYAAIEAPVAGAPAIVRAGTLYLVCGRGSEDDAAETARSCFAADPKATVAVIGLASVPPGARGLAPTDEAAFAALVRVAEMVCFLEPRQAAAEALGPALLALAPQVDVLTWPAALSPEPLDPEFATWLGSQPAGIAVRGHALGPGADLPLSVLASQGPAAVTAWAPGRRLNWLHRRDALTSPAATAIPARRRRPNLCHRLSVALWGLDDGQSDALDALLTGSADLEVEVLATSDAAHQIAADLQSRPVEEHGRVAVRIVDAPAELGPVALWSALGQAATGQVVLYCHGAVRPTPDAVRDVVQWALEPGIGAVSVTIADIMAGMPATDGQTGPILAGSPLFMAVSRKAIAEAGRFDHDLEPAPAAWDFARRLHRLARRTLILPGLRAEAPDSLVAAWTAAAGQAAVGALDPA